MDRGCFENRVVPGRPSPPFLATQRQVIADRPVDCVQLFYSALSRRSMYLTPRESNNVMLK